MGALALVFPGQGSQAVGMARPWQGHPAHRLWEEAGDILRRDVARLGSDAGAAELRVPDACQVALFVHHAVLLEAWRGVAATRPIAMAGHSLGEYSALLAAGVFGFADGLRLVEARARLTRRAAERSPGGMLACLGFDDGVVAEVAAEAGAHVANDNAPGQVVVAGSADALGRTRRLLDEHRGRVRTVEVGAAYHSPHMASAVHGYRDALSRTPFADATAAVVANVDAVAHNEAWEWPELLARQLVGPVRWRESVQTLTAMGVTEVVELGAAPVLSRMVKRMAPGLQARTVSVPGDLPRVRVGS